MKILFALALFLLVASGVGAAGKNLVQNGSVDISSATVKQFIFQKPGGTIVTKTANFSGTGTDGKLRYTTVAGDLDVAGSWYLQVYIEMPAGKWKSDVGVFNVLENL